MNFSTKLTVLFEFITDYLEKKYCFV